MEILNEARRRTGQFALLDGRQVCADTNLRRVTWTTEQVLSPSGLRMNKLAPSNCLVREAFEMGKRLESATNPVRCRRCLLLLTTAGSPLAGSSPEPIPHSIILVRARRCCAVRRRCFAQRCSSKQGGEAHPRKHARKKWAAHATLTDRLAAEEAATAQAWCPEVAIVGHSCLAASHGHAAMRPCLSFASGTVQM